MLRLHFSNRLDALTDRLVESLAGAPGQDVFTPDEVIVPSAALQRHVTLALARRQGVCANLRFSYLAQWLWRCLRQTVEGLPVHSALDPEPMAWRIDALFTDPEAFGAHPRLAAYLRGADAVVRLQLAQRVAALFDQLALYRPDWLAAWSDGAAADIGTSAAQARADERWQAALWQQLTGELPPAQRRLVDSMAPTLADALVAQGASPLPARGVHVFGLPTIAPAHLAVLQVLGAAMDIDLYALNPCREFWFDLVTPQRLAALQREGQADFHEVGHPLLAAWGRQTQSQLALLTEAAGHAPATEDFRPPAARHLLARVQSAILDLQAPPPGSLPADEADRSLELHRCHSRTRELEVLQDRLLALLAGPEPPALDDILVVTPDLDATAPAIDAIFGTAPAARRMPYAITGRASSQSNALARAWLQLLSLPASRCGVTEVYGLLQQPAVARRFGLDAEALVAVHRWLRAAGVHWGLDADHRAALGLPATARHSLADGVERLMLGYAMPDAVEAPFEGRLPAGDAEGSRALWLGALARCLDSLDRLRRDTAQPLPPPDWLRLLGASIDTFIAPADDELEDERALREALKRLASAWSHANRQAPIPLDAVRLALTQLLDEPARGGVPGGGITFSSMHSLRGLPYRVVCVIGLDDGEFPSGARAPEFDLMALAPRLGDRQRRLDDRNLMLDLLLAAGDVLHLSCIGHSARDNSPLPPSVLASELLETVLPWFDRPEDARRRLVIDHPLQPFAERAFRLDSPPALRSFQAEYAQALRQRAAGAAPAETSHQPFEAFADDDNVEDDAGAFEPLPPFFSTPLPAPEASWRVLPLERLIEFYKLPCRFLLRHRLGLQLRDQGDDLEDDEPLVPDWRSSAALSKRVLPALQRGMALDAARTLALAGAEWPDGPFAAEALDRELGALWRHAAELRRHTTLPAEPPHTAEIALEIEGQDWRITASWADLRTTGQVLHRFARPGVHDWLEAWLRHLALCAQPPAGVAPVTTWIGADEQFRLEPVADAAARLGTLIRLFERGLREPLYFFPRTSWALAERGGLINSSVTSQWRSSGRGWAGESQDPAVRLALRGLPDPLGEEGSSALRDVAQAVFDPLRAALRTETTA